MAERLVVIGGDAGGMGAATAARRLRPDLEIIAFERGAYTSYSACGIPYAVGGEVASLDDLVVRTPAQFREANDIEVRIHHEVTELDVDHRQVAVHDLRGGATERVDFDLLVIGTGARPRRPELPGIDHPRIMGVQTLDDGARLLAAKDAPRVVVVGGGYIGLEIAEAFLHRGAAVTVLERSKEVLGGLDPDMGAVVSAAMRRHGIDVRCGCPAIGFEAGSESNTVVVRTGDGPIEADLVVLGLGVAPNSELAATAGLRLGAAGAIGVDRRQHTSAEGVWAAGDCCESHHLVTGEATYNPLGTVANKQALVAGTNIGGGYATFPGVVGTAVSKICDTEVARTGLNEVEARRAGYQVHVATIEATTRAGYFPGAAPIRVKMIAERRSGRLLGAQIVGEEGAAKRIDVVATALHAGLTVEQMTSLDLSYAPPFSPAWDPVLVAARKVATMIGP